MVTETPTNIYQHWRRRFFRLQGTKLTAYREDTRAVRMNINLANATKLLDDKSALQQPSSSKGGGRRKSGFAEDEEGYMFMEEGFRIRFANGEMIDFYADSRAEKDAWMKALGETIGKDTAANKGWAAMVLEKERKDKAARAQAAVPPPQPKPQQLQSIQENANANAARPQHQRRQSDIPLAHYSKSVPSSPVKGHARNQSQAPAPPMKDARLSHAPAPRARDPEKSRYREQVRSMIF